MFDTSQDVLFLALALCAIGFTVFICILLLYLIKIIKNAHDVIKGVRKKLELVDDVLKTLKDRIEHSATYLGLLVEGVGKLVDYLKEKKKPKTSKKKKVANENIEE